MSEIKTERLLLRMITEADVEEIFEYSKTPNVGPNAGWKPHSDKEETAELMKLIFIGKETVWGIELKESGRLIGSVGLVEDPKREYEGARMLGYALGESWWGNGFMTEAVQGALHYGFYELKLALISAYCYSFNERSRRVLSKCGFEYEGTLKLAEQRYDGQIFDNECYILLPAQLREGCV